MRHAMTAALVVAAGCVCLQSARAQQPPARPDPQRPVFRADAHMVRVDAYPARDGRIIEGLTKADFEIFEDGRPQSVETFEYFDFSAPLAETARQDPNSQRDAFTLAADPRYRVFVIYLDVFHVDVAGSHAARRPIVDFLNRILGARDLFGVLTPRQIPMRDLLLGQQTLSIEEQLERRWNWGMSGSSEREPEELELEACFPGPPGTVTEVIDRRRLDKVFADLEETITILGGLRDERKNIILFSRGWRLPKGTRMATGAMPAIDITNAGKLTTGRTGRAGDTDTNWCATEAARLLNIDFERRHRDLLQQSRRANVTFYPVNPSGLEASSGARGFDDINERTDRLRELASNTDGVAITTTNDLRAGLARVADDLRASYVLGYYTSNNTWDGSIRRITVKLKTSGAAVRARREYRAPTEAEMATLRNPPASALASGPSPVDEALGALSRMRPNAAMHVHARAAHGEIAVVAELAAGRVEAGRWKAGADVQVIVTSAGGDIVGTGRGRLEPGARATLVHVPASAATAPWQVVVRVRGEGEEPEEEQLVVRDSSARVLGEPLLYRAAAAAASPLRPAAVPQFRRTERVTVEWPRLAPLDTRSARLLGRDGTPLSIEVPLNQRDNSGTSIVSASLNLAPLTAGDYVIQIVATAGGVSERRLVAIRVVR